MNNRYHRKHNNKRDLIAAAVMAAMCMAAVSSAWAEAAAPKAGMHSVIGGADGPTAVFLAGDAVENDMAGAYMSITMEEAKEAFEMFDEVMSEMWGTGDESAEEAETEVEEKPFYVILDVRHPDEFTEGHIPGAINLPNEEITDGTETLKNLPEDDSADEALAEDSVEELLPDKDQPIFVYCRSGRRSKEAAVKLAARGYTAIVECGGILDWTGDIEK